ncbi:hypothetical protein [Sphaerotilus microaerophilus]|uniref:Uncharacterized protein n=1 Tax=Sphaerotilus microaerophilus TaxID=2914710 RepID=A0ABM7YR88_9BURK|nr:hypothetical protein [Sphaerotilus sp. FB-5]BDI07076.1 hypothetical protein CATMQ487_40460 [Sphaerotilus sp. FB-5]
MPAIAVLLDRLQSIARSLDVSGHALALLGLGSVGQEIERLDEWSDLDFFAIVEPGHKARYLDDLGWLAAAGPLVWHYRNTPDGHKLLYADGVFGECAVFEPQELAGIPYAPGRLVWRRAGVGDAWAQPVRAPEERPRSGTDWLVGEALGNLHVGLQRWRRGERLAGLRLVEVHALGRLVELLPLVEPPVPGVACDPYNAERRLELRHPGFAQMLPAMVQGLSRVPGSALAQLDWLASHFGVAPAMSKAIRALAAQPAEGPPAEHGK